MRKVRLNGWQRIGVIASVVWIVGAPMYFDSRADKEELARADWFYRLCRDVESNREALEHPNKCSDEARDFAANLATHYTFTGRDSVNTAILSFAPVTFGW